MAQLEPAPELEVFENARLDPREKLDMELQPGKRAAQPVQSISIDHEPPPPRDAPIVLQRQAEPAGEPIKEIMRVVAGRACRRRARIEAGGNMGDALDRPAADAIENGEQPVEEIAANRIFGIDGREEPARCPSRPVEIDAVNLRTGGAVAAEREPQPEEAAGIAAHKAIPAAIATVAPLTAVVVQRSTR